MNLKTQTKYLFLPLTAIAWYFIGYYCIFATMILMDYIFNSGWARIIFGSTFGAGFFFIIALVVSMLLRSLISMLYEFKWKVLIIHYITGIIGVVDYLLGLYQNPSTWVLNGNEVIGLAGMWQKFPIRTIFWYSEFLFLALSMISVCVFAPIMRKSPINF